MKMPLVIEKMDKASKFMAVAICALFLASSAVYFVKTPARRHVFRFQSVDSGKNNIEARLLPYKRGGEGVSQYVEELLLGPKTERSRPLFSPGTKCKFCFVRGKTLYVNLTEDLLYKTGNASEIMTGIDLFRENILRTFASIRSLELYIEGKPVGKNREFAEN